MNQMQACMQASIIKLANKQAWSAVSKIKVVFKKIVLNISTQSS